MSDCNCTETMVSIDCKPEAERVAKVIAALSEKNQMDLESFLKAVDFLEQHDKEPRSA